MALRFFQSSIFLRSDTFVDPYRANSSVCASQFDFLSPKSRRRASRIHFCRFTTFL